MSQKRVKRVGLGCVGLIVVLICIYLLAGGPNIVARGQIRSTQTVEAAAMITPTVYSITFQNIPGVAYMDGRDLEALSPTIVTPINIWDDASRNKVVCELNHGDKVDVLDVVRVDSEERYYFQVQNGDCVGWVSDPFISPTAP
jgi:hypothetical protein